MLQMLHSPVPRMKRDDRMGKLDYLLHGATSGLHSNKDKIEAVLSTRRGSSKSPRWVQ